MLNPQQSININISYNMAPQKSIKNALAKRIIKSHKPALSTHPNCEIQIKMKGKNLENNLKKSNEHRLSNDIKKGNKKKQNSIVRNTITPDMFNDRRIRTQGPSAQQDTVPTLKKQPKAKHHFKSTQLVVGKIGANPKISLNKTTKSLKSKHVNSFSNWKKIPLGLGEHIVSQAISNVSRKKRAHSAFAKNDRVVSKLLNMSLLGSEMSGSQPITSERKSGQSYSKAFKEYMSTIDMKILRTMKDDVPIFNNKEANNLDIIRVIMKSKEISFEQLTRKAIIIQRAWRRNIRTNIIYKYKALFKQATDKLRNQRCHQGSQYFSAITQSIITENQQHQKIIENVSNKSSLNNSFNSQNTENNLRWIEQNDEFNQFNKSSKQESLNFSKYRELASEHLFKKSKESDKIQTKWNSINSKLSNIMNGKTKPDSSLLQDFIKQSQLNKLWIQSSNDERSDMEKTWKLKKQQNKIFIKSSKQPNICHEISNYDDDFFQSSQEFNTNKYANMSEEKQAKISEDSHKQSVYLKNINDQILEKAPKQFTEQIDEKWISHEIMTETVVQNYLDCGLGDFGLNINKKIMNLPFDEPNCPKEEDSYDYNLSSDETIGVKFQMANLPRKKPIIKEDIQPKVVPRYTGDQIDGSVTYLIQFLIEEFSADISLILKKTTTEVAERKSAPPQPRPQGIPTNLSSIKEYVAKFIAFVSQNDLKLNRIVDNINKDIGPSSMEILSYLRPQAQDGNITQTQCTQNEFYQEEQEQEGLFVIPADLFEEFQAILYNNYRLEHQKEMGPRIKAYLNFWHRCIFESYNQCLDYERPYGIQGKPYNWVTDTKIFRSVKRQEIFARLRNGENRLMDLTLMVGGIIFQKDDSPFAGADFSEEQKHRINQERLSRILACELLQSQQSWINYNDEMAELCVELTRMIEDKIFFECSTELRKLVRRRNVIVQDDRTFRQ